MLNKRSPRHGALPLLALVLLAPACSSPRSGIPRIAELYDAAAKEEARNPVIVIHGILGARLAQRSTGKAVWGAFTSDGIDVGTPEGARALALPLEPPPSAFDYHEPTADVYPSGPLEALELSVLFQLVSVEVYANILRSLGVGGYTDPVAVDPLSPRYAEDHFTCFTFFYDWRRDNVENAIRLARFIKKTRTRIDRSARAKITRLRAAGGEDEERDARDLEEWLERGYRFDLVAHSMGGLIARYYLRYGERDIAMGGALPDITWAGAEQVDRLIMVGTPNLGSLDAMQNLLFGYQPAFILPYFDQALLGSMPAIYQLLPRNRHRLLVDEKGEPLDVDLFDPDVWERSGWGLMNPAVTETLAWLEPERSPEERRAIARHYLTWCLARAKRFHAAMDRPAPQPPPTRMYLFASDTEETLVRGRLYRDGDGFAVGFGEEGLTGPGDGTVPRYSALADERHGGARRHWLHSPIPWTNVTFLADDHVGLTSNPHFTNNMLFLLLETEPQAR